MLSIIEIQVGITRVQEFTCPTCGKRHQWNPSTQQSPYACAGCSKIMMDITRVLRETKWREAYHLGGEKAVLCNTSV